MLNNRQLEDSMALLQAKMKSMGEAVSRMNSAMERFSDSMSRIAELSHRLSFLLTMMTGLPRYMGHGGTSMALYYGLGHERSSSGGGFGGTPGARKDVEELKQCVRDLVVGKPPAHHYGHPRTIIGFDTESTGPLDINHPDYHSTATITGFYARHGKKVAGNKYELGDTTHLKPENFGSYKAFLEAIHDFFASNPGVALGGQNIGRHDIPFLTKQFEKHGLDPSVLGNRRSLDSLKMGQTLFPGQSNSFEQLFQRLADPSYKQSHLEDKDVEDWFRLLPTLLNKFDDTANALWEVVKVKRQEAHQEKEADLKAIAGKQANEPIPGEEERQAQLAALAASQAEDDPEGGLSTSGSLTRKQRDRRRKKRHHPGATNLGALASIGLAGVGALAAVSNPALLGTALGGAAGFAGGFGLARLLGPQLKKAALSFWEAMKEGGRLIPLGKTMVTEGARKAAGAFIVGSTLASNALHAGAPDMFATLQGSFQLLAGTLGTMLIPFCVRLAGVIQDIAEQFDALSGSTKQTIGNVVGYGLASLAALIAVVKLGQLVGLAATPFVLLGRAIYGLHGAAWQLTSALGIAAAGAIAVYSWFKAKQGDRTEAVQDALEESSNKIAKGMKIPGKKELMEDKEVKLYTGGFEEGPEKQQDMIDRLKDYVLPRLERDWSTKAGAYEEVKKRIGEQGEHSLGRGIFDSVPLARLQEMLPRSAEAASEAQAKMFKFQRLLKVLQAQKEGKELPDPAETNLTPLSLKAARKVQSEGSAASTILYTLRGLKATPQYSSLEDLYKKIQLTAVDQSPLERRLLELQYKAQVLMLQELTKLTGSSEEVVEALKAANPGSGN